MSEFQGKKKDLDEKRAKEIKVVGEMIALYCRKNHGSRALCPECKELLEYAQARIEHCPFMETKTFCSNCKVHCYKKDMREKIRTVMRCSGPRMLLYHPAMAIWHVVCTVREKRRNGRA